jgi:hypothetical protein
MRKWLRVAMAEFILKVGNVEGKCGNVMNVEIWKYGNVVNVECGKCGNEECNKLNEWQHRRNQTSDINVEMWKM